MSSVNVATDAVGGARVTEASGPADTDSRTRKISVFNTPVSASTCFLYSCVSVSSVNGPLSSLNNEQKAFLTYIFLLRR